MLASMREQITRTGLRTAFTDLSVAGLLLAFAHAQLRSFIEHPRVSVLLIVVLDTTFALFFVFRRPASSLTTSPGAWTSTILGTILPLFMRPVPGSEDVFVAQVLQVAGTAFGLAGALSLNRSVGLLPGNRGVRSNGAYRIVRHPLYASYVITHLAYIASNVSAWNIAFASGSLVAQLVRIRAEEDLLSRDPEYLAYKKRTRWRLVPFVY